MDIVDVCSTLISNLGFPVSCVIAMFYLMDKERESHEEEARRWVEALNRNSSVIEQLLKVLEQ